MDGIRHFLLANAFFWGINTSGLAQVDTVQVSRDYKTMLVFPSPYDFAVNGKELNFLESFPQGSSSPLARNMVLLIYNDVAPDKEDHTNYTVYTQDGLAYDFILELVDIPDKKRWTVSIPMADNEQQLVRDTLEDRSQRGTDLGQAPKKPVPVDSPMHNFSAESGEKQVENMENEKNRAIERPLDMEFYTEDKEAYIRGRCTQNQFNKPKVVRVFNRSGKVFLWLNGVYYDKNEIYLQFRIENKEPIDYDLNFLKFSIATNYRNSSSNQKLEHAPIFSFGVPERIKGHSESHFIVVFDKFTLDRKKVLLVDMDEEKGNRNLSLSIDHYLINRPLSF